MENKKSPLIEAQWAYLRQEQHNDHRVSFVYNHNYTKFSLRGMK